MKKQKPHTKQTQNVPIKTPLQLIPFLPPVVIYAIFLGWTWLVVSNYYKIFPIVFPEDFFSYHGALRIPAFMSRQYESLMSVSAALLIFLASFGIGGYFIEKFMKERIDSSEKVFFSISSGLGITAIVVFTFGVLGVFNKLFFVILLLAAGSLAFFRFKSGIWSSVQVRFSFLEKMAIICFSAIAFFNLMGALTPEVFFDSQFYQLGVPTKWMLDGKIAVSEHLSQTFFPFNVNMIYMLAMILNGEISAKIIHYLSGLLVSFGVYALCKKYFGRRTGIFAALIFYSVPIVMMVSWKTAVELGISVFEFAMIFSLLKFFFEKKMSFLVLSGIFCGLSLGSKYTGIAFCYFPAAMTIIINGVINKEKKTFILRNVLFFSLISFLISSPWYIRNMINSGNPVFPFFWQEIGYLSLKDTGSLLRDPPPPKFSILNYLGFLWPLTMGKLQQESYSGPLFLSFGILFFVFRKIDMKIKVMFIYSFISIILWALLGRFYLRYFIPSMPALAIIFAYYITQQNTHKSFKKILLLLIIFLSLTNLCFSLNVLKNTQSPAGYVLGVQSKKEYLSTQRPGYPAPYYQTLEWANLNLPKTAKILFFGETRATYSRIKFCVNGVSDYSTMIEMVKQSQDAQELYEKLKADGISHILFNAPEAKRLAGYEIFYFEEDDLKIFDDFWKKHVREVYKDIADIYLPQYGISSMKKQQPDWWGNYASDPKNYVYLYEILQEDTAKSKPIPFNFLLLKEFYPEPRWNKISSTAEKLMRNE